MRYAKELADKYGINVEKLRATIRRCGLTKRSQVEQYILDLRKTGMLWVVLD